MEIFNNKSLTLFISLGIILIIIISIILIHLSTKKDISKIRITPFSNINELEFGVNRKEVWKKIGKPKKSFFKTPSDTVETDVYKNFHIYYDNNYNFEAIEVFNNIDIYYDNNKLPKKYSETLEYLKKRFNDIEENEYVFTTKEGSISVYKESEDDSIDAILIAKKNYY